MRRLLFLFLSLAAWPSLAAPLPDEVREAVAQLQKYDYTQPRSAPYTLEQFTPKADAEQRAALAALLARTIVAPDTTPLGRTILCQHLALVAGETERKMIAPLLNDPQTAGDARIVLEPLTELPPTPGKNACLADIASPKPASRIAGLTMLARFYPHDAMPPLLNAMDDPDPQVRATAIQLAGRLDATALATRLPKLDGPRQALALSVLAERKVTTARDAVLALVNSGDELVRLAAIQALGAVGNASDVPLLAGLARNENAAVKSAAETALTQLTGKGTDEAILAGMMSGTPAERVVMINAAAGRQILGLGPVLLILAQDKEETVREAALKALARVGGVDVYPPLVELLCSMQNPLLENAIIAVGRRLEDKSARLTPLLTLLKRDGVSVDAQVSVLRTLPPVGGPEALAPVCERLASADQKLKDAAVRALCDWPDIAALPELKKIAADPSAGPLYRALAERAVTRLSAPSSGGKASSRPRVSSAERREALAKSLPSGTRLVVYLDCGPQTDSASAEGARLRVTRGKSWRWDDEPSATVAFDPVAVVVEASGLDPQKRYRLGFTWWDYDANGRAQSVWIGDRRLIEKTALPQRQGPVTLTVPIPADAIREGKITIEFRREAASNAVVSELWLVEDATAVSESRDNEIPALMPLVKANAGAPKKALIVTGLEYPGHKWRETAPLLAETIGADNRLEVSVVEQPEFLASPKLAAYDVIVLNYQNHNVSPPEGALANLKRVVEAGKGLVLVHFACGAFMDWPTKTVSKDFLMIAGRVWNPNRRGHDPYGTFMVNIVDAQHPITKGMADFETTDELYTCLDGDVPVQVLAKATSKVDRKDYPMAFVLRPGNGRTFHCVLGHDVKAFNPPVRELYRRGTAWAAGL